MQAVLTQETDAYFDYGEPNNEDILDVADYIASLFPNHKWSSREHHAFIGMGVDDRKDAARSGLIVFSNSKETQITLVAL